MMKGTEPQSKNRFLLVLDILGFRKIVENWDAKKVYDIINEAIGVFDISKKQGVSEFNTLHFSDTFIFYQKDPSALDEHTFKNLYMCAAKIMTKLLAKKIPARGAISFGQFEISLDETDKHKIFLARHSKKLMIMGKKKIG